MATQNLDNELTRLRIDKSRKRAGGRGPRWLLILLLLAAGGGGYVYYARANTPVAVKLGSAVRSSGPKTGSAILIASGYVIPRNKIEVSPKVIGRIMEEYVDRGSKVKQGDVLLRLEDADFQAQVRQAEANLASARARLSELTAGSRPEEILASKAAVDSAEATLRNAESDLKRLKQLAEESVISKQEFDRAQMGFNVASANAESARRNFELVRKGPRQEQIDAARAQVRQAEASLDYAKTQLGYTVIHAPISGTILEKLAKKGELVSFQTFGGTGGAKTSVVSMADLTDLQVELDINESDLGKVAMEQECEIRMDTAPDATFKGKVDEVAPEADRQKGTVQVKVRINNPGEGVHPEVNARVTFLAGAEIKKADFKSLEKVFIPRAALVKDGENTLVYVAEGGKAQAKQVKVGDEGPDGVQVLEGLSGGEKLIINPPAQIKNGAKIESQ